MQSGVTSPSGHPSLVFSLGARFSTFPQLGSPAGLVWPSSILNNGVPWSRCFHAPASGKLSPAPSRTLEQRLGVVAPRKEHAWRATLIKKFKVGDKTLALFQILPCIR